MIMKLFHNKRLLQSIQEIGNTSFPLFHRATFILAPCRTCIVGVFFTFVIIDDTKRMTSIATGWILIHECFGLCHAIGEEGANEYLEVLSFGIIRRIGISYIVIGQFHTLSIFRMNDYS